MTYILGGKNQSSDVLEGQFWMKFAEQADVFDPINVGDYTQLSFQVISKRLNLNLDPF